MKGTFLKYILLVLLPIALLCSCHKNEQSVEVSGKVTATIPFTATVYGTPETRASVSGDALGNGCYIFETGDKLYVEYKDNNSAYKVYGVLNLVEGAGTGSAVFTGDLNCLDNFTIVDGETTLSATLVGSSAASGFFSFSDLDDDSVNDVVSDVTYPSEIEYASLANLVRRYSHFTGNTTFSTSGNSFTLTQQSVFLSFNVDFYKNKLSNPSATNVSLTLKNGESVAHTVSSVPMTGEDNTNKSLGCWTVLAPGTDVHGYKIFVDQIHCTPDFASNLTALEANHHYNVSRSTWDDFTIEATVDGTTTITFNYTGDGIQYRKSGESTWTSYNSVSNITLEKGQCLYFRGKKSAYNNSGKTKPLFTTNKFVYIYGDIMSLMCDSAITEYYERKTSLSANAFNAAFRTNSNANPNIDIHPNHDLVLSATTLAANCYQNLFRYCTALTKPPVIKATTLTGNYCLAEMFRQCSSLATVPTLPTASLTEYCFNMTFYGCSSLTTIPEDLIPATTLAKGCYKSMFYECSGLTSAPMLPAEILVDECYQDMFNGTNSSTNNSINSIICLATDISATNCISNWLKKVATSGTFYRKDDTATWAVKGKNGIPSGWTVMNYNPSTP